MSAEAIPAPPASPTERLVLRRVARRGLIWLALACLLVGALGEIMQELALRYDGAAVSVPAALNQSVDHEYLILGNSVAQQSVNPVLLNADLNLSGYNMSLPGASFITNEMCLRHYLRARTPPSLLLISVYVNPVAGSDITRAEVYDLLGEDLQAEAQARLPKDVPPQSALDRALRGHVPLIRARRSIPTIARVLVRGKSFVPDLIAGHAAYKFSSLKDIHAPRLPREGGVNFEALARLVAIARGAGVPRIVLFEPPCWPSSNAACPNRNTLLREVQEFAARHKLAWVSLNKPEILEQLPAEAWVNLDHLNAEGAKTFTPLLGAALRERLLAPSGDPR